MKLLKTLNQFIREVRIAKRLLPPQQFRQWLSGIPLRFRSLMKRKSLSVLDSTLGSSFTVNWDSNRIEFEKLGFGVVREIFGSQCYARRGDLKNAKNILDLGGNGGAFSIFALAEAPCARVHAVEIRSEMVEVLKDNAQRNGFADRLTVENAIVGGIHDSWTHSQLEANPSLRAFNIDTYIERVGECDFLKCDVEGGEFLLFQGKVGWLDRVRVMAIEYHPDAGNVTELRSTIESRGFHVKQSDHGKLGYFHCFRKEDGDS